MKILPASQRKAFDCNGKRYIPFGQIYPKELTPGRIRTPDKGGRTPSGYSQSLFFASFPDSQSNPSVFLDGETPVVFLAGLIYDYTPAKPLPPRGRRAMQTVSTEYYGSSVGVEYFICIQPHDAPEQEWCYYEYTEPGGQVFKIIAPTVADCRIYRDLWLENLSW